MHSFYQFLELMDHEFESINIALTQSGVRVDGNANSLKKHCRLNELKSVDYIYDKNNKFPLIEFSDISRQHNKLLQEIDAIKDSNLDKNLKRQLIIKHHKIIVDELIKKYKDTLSIIARLHQFFSDIPDNLQNKPLQYFIVIPPLHDEIQDKRVEVVRFLDALQSKITQGLPDEMYEEVRIIFIDIFARKF